MYIHMYIYIYIYTLIYNIYEFDTYLHTFCLLSARSTHDVRCFSMGFY